MKKALITGITGQDGSYLAELLLDKGYEVHGIKRRASSFNTDRIDHLYQDPHDQIQQFSLRYGDLSDTSSLVRILEEVRPDEVYNLGAPDPLSLEETAKIMCQAIKGSDYQMIPFPEDRKAIDVGDFICDYSAFRDQFGWEPKVNFEEGIQRSLKYFKDEIEHYI